MRFLKRNTRKRHYSLRWRSGHGLGVRGLAYSLPPRLFLEGMRSISLLRFSCYASY